MTTATRVSGCSSARIRPARSRSSPPASLDPVRDPSSCTRAASPRPFERLARERALRVDWPHSSSIAPRCSPWRNPQPRHRRSDDIRLSTSSCSSIRRVATPDCRPCRGARDGPPASASADQGRSWRHARGIEHPQADSNAGFHDAGGKVALLDRVIEARQIARQRPMPGDLDAEAD